MARADVLAELDFAATCDSPGCTSEASWWIVCRGCGKDGLSCAACTKRLIRKTRGFKVTCTECGYSAPILLGWRFVKVKR